MTRRWAPPTRYTLRRKTASIMKGLVLVWLYETIFNNQITEVPTSPVGAGDAGDEQIVLGQN